MRSESMIYIFIFLISMHLCGCSGFQRIGEPLNTNNYEKKETNIETRDSAIAKYNYLGESEYLHINSPSIAPLNIKIGGAINYSYEYVILSPLEEDKFIIEEVILLSNRRDIIELLRQKTEKTQGSHVRTIDVTIPRDIRPGRYEITTTINSGKVKKTARSEFDVIR